MADLVSIALDHAPRVPGDAPVTSWTVRFVSGDGYTGVLSHVHQEVYRLNLNDGNVVFFDARQVAWLSPAP